jgi:ribose/xylose/arabinose/galactoside ABC-type transport system permease subunit
VIVASFILGWLTPGLLQDGVSDTWTSIAIGVLLLGSLTVKGMSDRGHRTSLGRRLRARLGDGSPSPPATTTADSP